MSTFTRFFSPWQSSRGINLPHKGSKNVQNVLSQPRCWFHRLPNGNQPGGEDHRPSQSPARRHGEHPQQGHRSGHGESSLTHDSRGEKEPERPVRSLKFKHRRGDCVGR